MLREGALSPKDRPWRGRTGHGRCTSAWLTEVQAKCGDWPNGGLPNPALTALLDSLPGLARENESLYKASVTLLRVQSKDGAWRPALNRRLALVRRAAQNQPRPSCDAAILAPRKDVWLATKNSKGVWVMSDGRTLSKFRTDGPDHRSALWHAATKLPGLVGVEIPTKHLGRLAWTEAFLRAQAWLDTDHPLIKAARATGNTWRLALRRTEKYGIRGLFDPATQTVVVDPRHPETLTHELAHWVLGHSVSTPAVQAEREVLNY